MLQKWFRDSGHFPHDVIRIPSTYVCPGLAPRTHTLSEAIKIRVKSLTGRAEPGDGRIAKQVETKIDAGQKMNFTLLRGILNEVKIV